MEKFNTFCNKKYTNLSEEFEKFLVEGVYDKAIFKAVFLQGPPGSGKDYVLDKALSGHGLIEINSDKAFEYLLDKEGLSKKMPESEKEKRGFIRLKAKNTTDLQHHLALHGRNGLIINGTGDTLEKIKTIKDILEKRGYETMMLSVNVSDDISKQRNIERGERGGRTIPENIRREKFDNIQKSKPEIKKLFGDNYMEYDNSVDFRFEAPEIVDKKKDELMTIFKKTKKFVEAPLRTPESEKWISKELTKKNTLPIKTNQSNNNTDAKRLGLDYYGFGRYGKNHKVTHKEMNGKLIPVQISENKVEYHKDKDNKIKKYKVRRFAAKDAHQMDGEVVVVDGKEYVIKKKKIKESFASDIDANDIFLSSDEIEVIDYMNINENINALFESIDLGIEPGMALNSYAKEKINKNGKITVTELTGDESTATISSKKEDELRKTGIALSSFRAKNII